MALFAIWHDESVSDSPDRLHAALLAEAPILPDYVVREAIDTERGRWQLSAFACATHFYDADGQIWLDPAGGACVVHGLAWRRGSESAALLDAKALAALLPVPGMTLPEDVAGEYAIARLYRDGTVEAFGDTAGLHQIFYHAGGASMVANRASFVACLNADRRPDVHAALWLAAIGYRVGEASAWTVARQLPQGARVTLSRARNDIVSRVLRLPQSRGFAHGGETLLAEGLEQAKAAILLGAEGGKLDLPITGGKDSRVVLGIALAAGLKDGLTLFTRGYAGHPDVLVGEQIAAHVGLPHRREPPLGSDLPADLPPRAFLRLLATIAWQTDGAIGGWDNVSGRTAGRDTIVSGHLGEVLKAYAKRAPDAALDPASMVRLQAPFDPLDLLRQQARADLLEELARKMSAAREAGAEEGDLADLFYWQNRVPNWLGGIRTIKSFERQPILPLGVPALVQLAFQMTAAERKAELAHFKLLEATAPELIDLPFAHQSWDPSLGARDVAPILATAGAPLFGSWQWSINRVPAVRASLAALFADVEIPLWDHVDRARLLEALHTRRFDYFDGISLLGIATAAIHQAGLGLALKLGGAEPEEAAIEAFARELRPQVSGHLDLVRGSGVRDGNRLLVNDDAGEIIFDGWLHVPDWPGATPVIELRAGQHILGTAAADRFRPDLLAAGIGHGHYGFSLAVPAGAVAGAGELTLGASGCVGGPDDGQLVVASADAHLG